MSSSPWRWALMPVVVAATLAGTVLYAVHQPASGSAGPTFYGDVDYGGPAVTLGAGDYDLAQLQAAGKANDNISSVRVPSGYTVVAFQHSGFTGTRWTFTADNPNMTDTGNSDAISSMRITRT